MLISRADYKSRQLYKPCTKDTTAAEKSADQIQKDGTQDNSHTRCTNQTRAPARRGTWCGGGISSGSGIRPFDDSNSNVGGVGTGASGECGSRAAEGDIRTLISMSARSRRPRRNSHPAVPTDRGARKEWDGATGKRKEKASDCW
jgi:hypothetical protein